MTHVELATQEGHVASGEVSDQGVVRLLGHEIRRTREAKGWTRLQLVKQLPSGIGDRTLLTYEHGIRHMTVARLVEVCRVLEVSATVILHRAMEKAGALQGLSFKVNLQELLQDQQPGFEQVRRWAAIRLRETSNAELTIAAATVREMAAVLGMTHRQLAAYLVEFTSDATPDRE